MEVAAMATAASSIACSCLPSPSSSLSCPSQNPTTWTRRDQQPLLKQARSALSCWKSSSLSDYEAFCCSSSPAHNSMLCQRNSLLDPVHASSLPGRITSPFPYCEKISPSSSSSPRSSHQPLDYPFHSELRSPANSTFKFSTSRLRHACFSSLQSSRIHCLPLPSASASSEEVVLPDPEQQETGEIQRDADGNTEKKKKQPRNFQSSWHAKDSEGKDYLYRLGKESDNLNIAVGARAGIIDDIFIGDFLGKDADIVFDYRQKVTRSFQHLQGEYYIAPAFLETVVTHIAKNYLAPSLDTQVPLILGIWGGKGQGKSFQLELICKALDMEPVIMSAGELESEWAGQPGKLIRERYRTASQVIKNQGKMSALVINDLDAGIGRFENTQCTVNNQMVVGTLMNLADNPTRVSIGQEWREADIVNRVPIIVTGNDLSTLWAPLIRDGRMNKFYWQPTREDIVNIVHQMYCKDGLSMEDIGTIVDTFPNQALDFYGALRSRTYDKEVLKWIEVIGGAEKLGEKLVSRKKRDEPLPTFVAPEATVLMLIEAGDSLVEEQRLVNEMRLSDVYMKKQTGGGGLTLLTS